MIKFRKLGGVMKNLSLYDVELLRPFVGIPNDISSVTRFPEMAESYAKLKSVVPDDMSHMESIVLSKYVRTKSLVESKISAWISKMSKESMEEFNTTIRLFIYSYKSGNHEHFAENIDDKFSQNVYLKSLVKAQEYEDFLYYIRQQRLDVFPQDRLHAHKGIEIVEAFSDGEELEYDENDDYSL